MSWVVCQFACVVYLAHLIKDSSASTVARKSSTVTIPYHLFFAVTRWKEQQKQSLTSEVKNGALFSALIVVVTIALFNFGFANYRTLQQFILAETPEAQTFLAPLPGSSSGLQPFINKDGTLMDNAPFEHPPPLVTVKADNLFGFWALIVSALCFALTQLFIISKPTHIRFTPNGWQFLWRRGLFSSDGEPIRWESLERIYIAKDKLCFLLKNKRLHRISLSAIVSVDDRERFLLAIQQWASSVARDHSVNEALQPPPNHSYTELWLQALSAPPKRERLHPLLPGLTLHNSRYKVLNQLGTGGQGQAYLAQDQQDNIQVVLKEFILPVYVDTKVRRSALEQFENEARILRQLDHPQIVKLLDFFVEDHRSYLVLEHITGMTLRDLVIRDGPLPEGRVTALALQMCSILEYLHHREPTIVHRDFTPENLILSNEGSLRVIDFNVAKQIVEATTSGTVVGKHAYLPPEQFRGMPQAQSDIYAMGATMHFLLTGYDPEPISVSHPKQLCAHLSEHLNRIVERATALDVEKRYQSASQVAEELSQ
jgi:tRNA A-37 threonylcarbamoyl transferase component Bud32